MSDARRSAASFVSIPKPRLRARRLMRLPSVPLLVSPGTVHAMQCKPASASARPAFGLRGRKARRGVPPCDYARFAKCRLPAPVRGGDRSGSDLHANVAKRKPPRIRARAIFHLIREFRLSSGSAQVSGAPAARATAQHAGYKTCSTSGRIPAGRGTLPTLRGTEAAVPGTCSGPGTREIRGWLLAGGRDRTRGR